MNTVHAIAVLKAFTNNKRACERGKKTVCSLFFVKRDFMIPVLEEDCLKRQCDESECWLRIRFR